MKRTPIVKGARYGSFTIVGEAPSRRGSDGRLRVMVEAQCDCGTVKIVNFESVRRGGATGTKSCGCIRSDSAKRRCVEHPMSVPSQLRHGEARTKKHSAEYRAWLNMIDRCYRPGASSFQYYGSRGIRVCDEWRNSYEAFLAHVGRKPSPSHSLDRIDVNGNYEAGNVRWANAKEQRANQRPRPPGTSRRTMGRRRRMQRELGIPLEPVPNRQAAA